MAVIVPVKPPPVAKSRLRAAFGEQVSALAHSMAADVLGAATAASAVSHVYVVSSDDGTLAQLQRPGVSSVREPSGAGLNGALAAGVVAVREADPDAAIIAMPADCPAVAPADFDRLARELAHRATPLFVPDAAGTGTCALCLPPGSQFQPAYGPGSAARHRAAGAEALRGECWARVQRDVDVPSDLEGARRLGVGPATQRWLRRGLTRE